MLNQSWGINVEVKRFLMRPNASVTVLHNIFGAVPVRAKIHLDPWLVSAGITYRFGGPRAPVVTKY